MIDRAGMPQNVIERRQGEIMTGKLTSKQVDPMFERIGALRLEVERVTGEMPRNKRGMSSEEFERLLRQSLADKKLAPALRGHPPTAEIVVD